MADHDDAEPTPEQEIATARQALAAGDLPHALHHVGCALASNPMNQEWMGLLNQVIGSAPDPMKLAEVGENPSYVDAANRAYILAWVRRWEEALDLITDVAEVRPDIPYMLWCEWWLSQPGMLQSMTVDSIMRGIAVDILKIASSCPVPTPKDDPRLPTLESGARVLAAIRAVHATQGMLWFGSSMVARRLGHVDEALAYAQHAYSIDPSWNAAIGVANALKDSKKFDDAAKWFRKALDHDKEDVSAHLDLGDMYLELTRYDEALREYDAAMKKQPDQPWAKASSIYTRWKMNPGDLNHRVALLRLTEGDQRNDRARQLCDLIDPPRLYINRLPHPGDASHNALDDIMQEMFYNPAKHFGSTVKLELSHVESPSVVAGFWLQMEMWGVQVGLDYQVRKVQEPDPRVPKTQVPFSLWSWEGGQPRPNVPRPNPTVVREIHNLAGEPFSLDLWNPAAERVAQKLGGAGAMRDVLATMVFPPRPPGSNWRVLPWVQRSQIACALVVAHMGPGWAGSQRQQGLYALLYGPSDWTTGAAIVALGVLARQDAAIRAEVTQAFGWMYGQIPKEGYCPWELPLVQTWLYMPDLDAATRQRLEEHKERIFANKVGVSTVHLAQIEAKKFDQAEEVAKAQQAAQQLAAGGGGDPDPTVFPGQRVAKLSDYVGLMKGMQTGNMMGALGKYGLDMMGYASVATAWGQKLAADATLNAKFAAMMAR
ncbi:MAG TPA: tetratricopeptide repeat protein [Kofleriaceae bacterium]|nr:tetratricopeptide repeat protein [Kofleriaceae bacterium]